MNKCAGLSRGLHKFFLNLKSFLNKLENYLKLNVFIGKYHVFKLEDALNICKRC